MPNFDLPSGILHIPDGLTIEDKAAIEEFLVDYNENFFSPWMSEPTSPNEYFYRAPVFSFGNWWDPIDHKYSTPKIAIPSKLTEIGNRLYSNYWAHQKVIIDSIVVNKYSDHFSSLAMHKDDLEDRILIESGSPVMTLSIGRACRFCFGSVNSPETEAEIMLKDRSVLFFGGQSRQRFHGVAELEEDSHSTIRYSLTFRQTAIISEE